MRSTGRAGVTALLLGVLLGGCGGEGAGKGGAQTGGARGDSSGSAVEALPADVTVDTQKVESDAAVDSAAAGPEEPGGR